MVKRGIVVVAVLLMTLTGCSDRLEIVMVPPDAAPSGTPLRFWVAKFRQPGEKAFGLVRPDRVIFERHRVSIPPSHEPGVMEAPKGAGNPAKEFVTRAITDLGSAGALVSDIRQRDQSGAPGVLVFVHGYNTSHAHAVYSFAQILTDYEIEAPGVLFSWPSAAQLRGYVYDRDSVAISRDRLEQLIHDLNRSGRPVVLVGHSMGTMLIMETLRQMEIKDPGIVGRKVSEVILISPDIDPEVFREQMSHIKHKPKPFLLLTSQRDEALRVSGLLTGRDVRLGTLTDPERSADLPVTVVDMTALANGKRLNHTTFATSPTAIALLRNITRSGEPGLPDLPHSIVLDPEEALR